MQNFLSGKPENFWIRSFFYNEDNDAIWINFKWKVKTRNYESFNVFGLENSGSRPDARNNSIKFNIIIFPVKIFRHTISGQGKYVASKNEILFIASILLFNFFDCIKNYYFSIISFKQCRLAERSFQFAAYLLRFIQKIMSQGNPQCEFLTFNFEWKWLYYYFKLW